jgi:anti-sigma-K factor RskA
MTDRRIDHESLAPLAHDYVLGSLADHDARAFESHLSTCDECRREVRELSAVFEGVARSLDVQTPPAALRNKVLARATSSTSPRAMTESNAEPWRWLAIAAVLIAALLTASTLYYRNDASRARSEQVAAATRARELERQIAALQANAATASQTTTVLTAADLARVDLAGQSAAPGAAGRVFWSPTHGLVFAATNLPPLPPGRVYQLWVVGDQPVSAGIAQPSASGFSVVTPTTVIQGAPKAFAVTIEPEGGRPAPTGAMFLVGSL